jgi:hypothetical protein
MPTITPTGQDQGWLEAIQSVKGKGRLPTNAELDEVLNKDEPQRKQLRDKNYFAARASTVLVHPKENGTFSKDKDINDPYTYQGKHMVFLGKNIPKEAIGKKGISLVIEPDIEKIEQTDTAIIIPPKSILILKNSLQESGWGKVDQKTKVPVAVPQKELDKLPEDQKRYLWRNSTEGVRPLVRGYGDYHGRYVYADVRFDGGFGVGFVKPSSGLAKLKVSIREKKGIELIGIDAEDLNDLVLEARNELEELSKVVKSESTNSITKLLNIFEKD